mgnify:CR=1 FL=1
MIFQVKAEIIPQYRGQVRVVLPVVQSMNEAKALVVGHPHRHLEEQVMEGPVQTQPKIREEHMEMVKLQACSEVVAEEGLLLIQLVVVVVVPWQWMPMVPSLLMVPY